MSDPTDKRHKKGTELAELEEGVDAERSHHLIEQLDEDVISCKDAARLLGLDLDNPEQKQELTVVMNASGWEGPRMIRLKGEKAGHANSIRGFVRGDDSDAYSGYNTSLPAKLERTTRLGMRELQRILKLKLDPKNGNQLRAKVSAAGIAINAQLRADEARLKAKVRTDTMERLLKIVEQQKQMLLDDK